MTRKESGGNKYIVRLSDEERDRLNALINAGKHPARRLLKARILGRKAHLCENVR